MIMSNNILFAAVLLVWLVNVSLLCHGGYTSPYVRDPTPVNDLPKSALPRPPGHTPDQVHITQGDHDGGAMIISWVTWEQKSPNTVFYWPEECTDFHNHKHKRKKAMTITYTYTNYKSGYIHHATISDLEYDTKYLYHIGTDNSSKRFSFTTPPAPGPDVPYTFGISGDLGQTYCSNKTLEHYMVNNGQTMLFTGDLAYADHYWNHDNERWDTFGRLIEKNAAYQPWIWAAGNHELDYLPNSGETEPFKPFINRYPTPYKASASTSPLWYSIKRGPAYIIVLSSYSAYGKYTPQYTWLQQELPKINRKQTPWVIVLVHAPWYNTFNYHYMEGETMRVQFESWFVNHKVDLVLAGHVHGYERLERISNVKYNISNKVSYPVRDASAPVYITLGDGGNIEGIANNFINPQPDYSAFREASFGHAILDIKNRTHAYYAWHRNMDNTSVAADYTWFYNRYWYPQQEPRTMD